jgi:hypothetical protein
MRINHNAEIKSDADFAAIEKAKECAKYVNHDLKRLHVFSQIAIVEYRIFMKQKRYKNAAENVRLLFIFLIEALKHKWRDDQSIYQTYLCGMELLIILEQYESFWSLFGDFVKNCNIKLLPVNRQFSVLLLFAEYLKGIKNYIEAFYVCDHLSQYGVNHTNPHEYLRSQIILSELFEYAFDKKRKIKYSNIDLFNEISNCSVEIDKNKFENHHDYLKEVLRQREIVKETLKWLCMGCVFKPFDKNNKTVNDELKQVVKQFLNESSKLISYLL